MLIDKLLSIPKTWVYINLFQNDCWVSNYTHYETIVPTVFTCFVFSNPENNGDHGVRRIAEEFWEFHVVF